MKHVRKVSKTTPASAWWFGWFTNLGELNNDGAPGAHEQEDGTFISAKVHYINSLWQNAGSLDPRDV